MIYEVDDSVLQLFFRFYSHPRFPMNHVRAVEFLYEGQDPLVPGFHPGNVKFILLGYLIELVLEECTSCCSRINYDGLLLAIS